MLATQRHLDSLTGPHPIGQPRLAVWSMPNWSLTIRQEPVPTSADQRRIGLSDTDSHGPRALSLDTLLIGCHACYN